MSASPLIRILVSDEYELFRSAVGAAFDADSSLTVVAHASDLAGTVELTHHYQPDVVVLSMGLPGLNGMAACEQLVDQARILAVGERPDHELLVRAVQAGVHGYATKDMKLADLVTAVRCVHRGEAVVPPSMLSTLLRRLVDRNRVADRAVELSSRLTRREREVLELLVGGCDHQTVAEILVISPQTARTHIQNVINKLGVHSRLEAAALAVEHGLVERPLVGREA